MLLQLLRFEVRYQSKQRALPIAGLLFFALGYFLGNAGNAPALVDFNAPFQISYYTGNTSLLSVFIIMFFAVSGTIRDRKHQMESLIYSTSVRKRHFFWSRFIGVFLFSVIGFSLFLPGFWLGLSLSDLDAARIAPFQLQSYLWPFLVIIVPNVFIFSSVLFSVSLLSRNTIATYASAVLVYLLYFIVGIYSNSPMFATSIPASPEQMAIAALADPFAISTFFEHTHFWTPFEKSNSRLSFSGNYFWNRVLWIGFSLLVLTSTYRLFSFRKMASSRRKKQTLSTYKKVSAIYQAANIQINSKTQWSAFTSSVTIEIKAILQSLPFIAVLLVLFIALLFELYIRFFEGGFYNESWYPFTHLVIETVIEIIPILSNILIVFYSGEILWNARDQKFDGILNATPSLNWVFFLSKLATLVLLPLLLIATVIVVSLIFQLVNGFTQIDVSQYLLLFYHYGTPVLVISLLAIFIQSMVRNKYLGMGITGGIILALATPISYHLGIEHPMLRIGVMPSIKYSNMSGYGIQAQAFASYALYWVLFGLILALLSLKLWNRQLIEPGRIWKDMYKKPWKLTERITLSISIITFLIVGNIFYIQLNSEGDYQDKKTQVGFRVQYERKFKQFEELPRFTYAAMKTAVNLYPKEEKYTVSADYQLINKNSVPITKIFLTERKQLSDLKLERATLIFKNTVFGTYLFEFDEPVLPNQTIKLQYQLTNQSLPFQPDHTIVKNGTYLRHEVFEPLLGYQEDIELSDPGVREKLELPEQKKSDANYQQLFTTNSANSNLFFETIVSTSADQMALAPGNLVRQWTTDGRNFYHYKYLEKNLPIIAYLSAAYEVKKQVCNGVTVEYYYHPGHDINHQTIEASACTTLSYGMKNFGKYPFTHLRIAEIPSFFPIEGAAHPGLISMVEDKLYLVDIRNNKTFDLVAKRTAKEIAHQWWGMALLPKSVPGAGLLTRGLSKYTAAVVLEEMYGIGARWELSKSFNQSYFRGRTFTSTKEPPLYLNEGEGYLTNGKSGLVLLSIRDLIGEEKLNTALRNLIELQTPNYEVQTLDFIEELYKVTPEEDRQLITDWMEEIIRYELSVDNASYKPLKDGKYALTATISAERFKTLPSGKEVAIGINEPITIGCFDKHPKEIRKTDRIFHLEEYRIKDNLTTIKIVVDTIPKYISIDPFLTRLDRNYADNLKVLNPE